MHLKSLVLKGFKSFADRSVLSLQPGITAIVGPNGSGKSNISDAVLWVLGERNARNLRGQAMEDVIFSGSSDRKPVSVAEVELVLDNSDGVLPVDFDEVSIARRMYRTGESEYLINGTVARRLDVLDILHDTGLGTGTHSIISQGSLDSILQSKPEDRRALIEEAAGVLKHKQRKEKSARKLEKMDNHLARVRDVSAEIQRQLGPLERKAKRAIAYGSASKELAEVRLSLAVDDLRKLQGEWDAICANEVALAEDVERKRQAVDASEAKAASLAEVIRAQSLSAGELAKSQREASAVAERLESAEMLVREKRQAARAYEEDLSTSQASAEARLVQAEREHDEAAAQLAEVNAVFDKAQEDLARITQERNDATAERRKVEDEAASLNRDLAALDRKLEQVRTRRDALKEGLSAGLAHERIVEARRTELAGALDRAQTECDAARAASAQAEDALAQADQANKDAQAALSKAFAERDAARAACDAAKSALTVNDSETQAIKRAQRAQASDDPALLWVIDHASDFSDQPTPLAAALGAPQGLEMLVEKLLEADLSALMVKDAACAQDIAAKLFEASKTGDVTLVLNDDARPMAGSASARSSKAGTALVDLLAYPAASAAAVEALVGDVVVCDTRDQAFAAHAADTQGLTFVSRDGCMVSGQGRVKLFGKAADASEGVLARERRLAELGTLRAQLEADLASADRNMKAADEAYQAAQAASLKAGEEVASARGKAQSLAADAERAATQLARIAQEAEDIENKHEEARKAVANLQPTVDAVTAEIAQLEEERARAKDRHKAAEDQVIPLRTKAGKLAEAHTNAKLEATRLTERKTYAERMLQTREREIGAFKDSIAESRKTIYVKHVAQQRTEPLLIVLEDLSRTLRARIRLIEDAVLDSQNSTSDVHAKAAQAREEERAARDDFDKASSAVSEARIAKSRLEIQVETAVKVIVEDCGTPIDVAQTLPALEDRASAEDAAFKLERRIKNMGVINPDAAQEYEALKKRYDFFAVQVADMEDARKSLAQIVRIIDARMKDDFVNTFNLVNENFKETFSRLFPGGQAELVLLDPDNIDASGIEVKAQPRGKRITKMSLLSGGEKSLTAIALLFAIYRVRSTPFYILDEVEAALDDTNLRRLIAYVNALRDSTQLLMITHQRRTMETADVLFGVSMQDGVTKVVSQKLEHALEHAE